jgi:predicted secreted hydrolase
MRRLWLPGIVLLLLAMGWLWAARWSPSPSTESSGLDIGEILGGVSDAGFARAYAGRAFRFPRDDGPHPQFRNEWWYFTGNLFGDDGRRFGYELTLFRFALTPLAAARTSHWATNQVYMGHFALTDAEGHRFQFYERFSRGALGLAGAQSEPFGVWLEDWGVRAEPRRPDVWRLTASTNDVALALALTPAKPIVLEGNRGLSRKSAEAGNASYYYSRPRLASTGTITLSGRQFRVHGMSWMDREWGTSALARDEVGWDWFALQLSDGWDFIFYQLRRADGRRMPFSAGMLIDPAGHLTPLNAQDVAIEVLDNWRSPHGGNYPARWRLAAPSAALTLEVTPVLADQELAASVRYWEGAVNVTGKNRNQRVQGVGYTELTGYAASVRSQRR